MDQKKIKKIHFIGCGGVSMSALMALAKKAGLSVSGSDLKISGHSEENIKSDFDLVVYTASITEGSEGFKELKKARELGIKTVSRGEYLASLVNQADKSVVVSGMHGKTTVTTMIGTIFQAADLNPTVIPGTTVNEFGGNYLAGSDDLLVTEGCEYYDSFLHLKPKVAVITNIEEEHLDYFKDLDTIISSFAKFISNIAKAGCLVYFAGDENIKKAIERASSLPETLIPYGPASSEAYQALDFEIFLPGEKSRFNALAALAVSNFLGVSREIAEKVLSNYKGAGRRMEIKGQPNGILIIDDYGHHPTEISSTIKALKESYPSKRLVVAFWPHQYKRIASLFKEFSESFRDADQVLLLPIYFVPGRDEKLDISSEDLAAAIAKKGVVAIW
jgi:UDP-N-acetylmuramate--alanine ligase